MGNVKGKGRNLGSDIGLAWVSYIFQISFGSFFTAITEDKVVRTLPFKSRVLCVSQLLLFNKLLQGLVV